ncbi:MAG: glycosyltransferase, partial [Verrucomicrobiales bacterium]|nr:glycosyltransferase [Verrucomicrobiales bacterium]
MLLGSLYFCLRPFLPLPLRVELRRRMVTRIFRQTPRCQWPIDSVSGRTPVGWPGWPNGKRFAVVLTHDVESLAGIDQSDALAQLEEKAGFRSSFNFVPIGNYQTPPSLRQRLQDRGFEIGVHDLRHDGQLYRSRGGFRRNAQQINQYLRGWGATGFRSAFMLHRLDWLHDLEIEYDASTFDTDPFEPQPDGASTIFPFWVPAPADHPARTDTTKARRGYVELPYTLPQDSTLFVYLEHRDIEIWKRKVDWIAERGGMVLLNLHPDYVAFPGSRGNRATYPPEFYQQLLAYIGERYSGSYWHALPRDVARYVREVYGGEGPRRPRHACMLSYSFFDQDNRVNRYALALAERGDVVEVLSLKPASAPSAAPPPNQELSRPPETQSSPVDYHLPGVRVHYVQTRRRDEKRASDFLLRVLNFCWRSSRLLIRLHRTRRFDLIHVHNVPDFIIFAAWYPRLRGAKLILDLHDLLPEFYQSKFKTSSASLGFKALLWCERLSCRFADHVIVSNDLWREKVARRSMPPERCSAMVNHVDTKPYEAHRCRVFPSDLPTPTDPQDISTAPGPDDAQRLVAIFPGGWYYHQGLHIAIRAIALLAERLPNLRLRIIGDGPERESLTNLVRELGVESKVLLEPPVPLRQIPSILSEADIGIVPKLAEGFGNEAYSTKIMEFMAAGLPVVASRTRIDEFYFGHGQVHFFESANPADMARALEEVINDAALRERLV